MTRDRRRTSLQATLLLCALFAEAAATAQQLSEPLLLPSTTPRASAQPPASPAFVVRQRDVSINAKALPPGDQSAPNTLRLNFFDDTAIDVYLERLQYRGPKDYTWLGGIVGEDEPDGMIMVVKDDVTLISVRSIKHGVHELRLSPDGEPVAREIDPTRLPGCGTTNEHAISAPQLGAAPRSARDSSSVLDILVTYTPAARAAAGSVSVIEAGITLAVADANEAYTFSNIPTQLRLVHMFEDSYIESGDSGTDLSRLKNPADGFMDAAHTGRNTYGADLVALITVAADVCGTAYRMTTLSSGFEASAFSITTVNCLNSLTFAHEVGHNLGSHHAVGDAGLVRGGPNLRTYSYGWRWTGNSAIQWRSVMASSPGSRTARFSNPDVLYDGVPTGVPIGLPDEAHNAASINSAISTAANWRATVNPMAVSPASGLTSEGGLGGPFSPADKSFTILNSGFFSFNWTASKTQAWLTLSSTSGSLGAGASANVIASINSNALGLPTGNYTDTITFTDTTNAKTTTRDVVLDVLPQTIQSFSFDSNPGWTTQEDWAFGAPQGVGGDPSSGRTGANVYGYNLAGVYSNNQPEYNLTTTAINCAAFTGVTLRFWRWLGVEESIYDRARVDVSNNGSAWTTVWDNTGPTIVDSTWQLQTFDISAIADQQPTVYIRWTMGATDVSLRFSGWNIDDVGLFGNFTNPPTNLAEAWVDFSYLGAELGITTNPFNSIAEAVAALKSDGTGLLKIKGNTADTASNETPTITKPMTIQAINGAVTVGAP